MLLLQTNAISDALNSSEWVFPIAECFHIAAFAWSIGMIALVDFRLLGLGLQRETSPEIARATAPWTLLGLAVVLLSGPILFLSDPRMYSSTPRSGLRSARWCSRSSSITRFIARSRCRTSSSTGVRVVGRGCFSGLVGQRCVRRAVHCICVSKLGRLRCLYFLYSSGCKASVS